MATHAGCHFGLDLGVGKVVVLQQLLSDKQLELLVCRQVRRTLRSLPLKDLVQNGLFVTAHAICPGTAVAHAASDSGP